MSMRPSLPLCTRPPLLIHNCSLPSIRSRLDCSPSGSTRPLPHCFFFVQHNHVISVTASSPPTSSTPTIACCVGTFYPAVLRTATVAESSAGPSDADAWLGPSTLYGRYWQHWRVLSSSTHCWVTQTQPTPRSTRLDCIDFDIDPPIPTPSA
jgi:hypothetical protein